jgi:hypothetical protein
MAEVEIHAAHEHAADDFSKGVSVMVGVIGIVLAVVTIASHRAHTASIIELTGANDQWSFYQAKKLREHLLDVGAGLLGTLAPADPQKAHELADHYAKERERYAKDAQDIQREAVALGERSKHEENRALRLDLGEGLLELGLVLSSLYFLSKRRFFPLLGGIAAILGAYAAITSLWVG